MAKYLVEALVSLGSELNLFTKSLPVIVFVRDIELIADAG